MVSTQAVVIIGVVLMRPVLWLVALWLRLHFQLRGVRERRRFLLTAATALPGGSRIQVHRGVLVLIVGATRQNEEQQ